MGSIAKGRREVTVKLCTTAIICFFIYPPHSKLGSEVVKYLVKAKQKSSRRKETWNFNSSFYCAWWESLWKITTKLLSLSKWISEGIFQFSSHFSLRNTKHQHQKILISPTCPKTVAYPHIQEFWEGKDRMGYMCIPDFLNVVFASAASFFFFYLL